MIYLLEIIASSWLREKVVLIHDSVARGGEEMALCLADVLLGTDEKAEIQYLSVEEEDELLNWDAEKYRQSLNS